MRRILGPSACGSLKPELEPGTFVICDQFVDRTRGREDTFYDGPADHPRLGRGSRTAPICGARSWREDGTWWTAGRWS